MTPTPFFTLLLAISAFASASTVVSVKADELIGKKFTVNASGKTAGIPGYISTGGYLMGSMTADDLKSEGGVGRLALAQGLFKGVPVFRVDRKLRSGQEGSEWLVVDAQKLPIDMYRFKVVNGKPVHVEGRYFLDGCHPNQFKDTEKNSYHWVGLFKPMPGKDGCEHDSTRVKRVWRIDLKSGQINEVPAKGMRCTFISMDDCE